MPNPIEAAWAYQAGTAKLQRSLFVAVRKLWKVLPADPYAARDALIEQGTQLAERYGEAAVGLAADFFEAATGLPATPADVDLAEQVEGSARWAAGDLFAGNPSAAQKKFTGAMQRHAMQPGRDTLFDGAHKRGVLFARIPQGDTCAWCLMLASRGFAYTSARHAGEGNRWHDWCVVPGTRVSGPPAEVGMRRRYEGEIITLVTASGNELTITPNHPVLTDRGWVAPRFLQEGDNLVSGPRVDRAVAGGPYENHGPSRIEDVVSALRMVRTAVRRSMPVAAEQFHGDGFDSEVDVVAVNDLFGGEFNPTLSEPIPELQFKVTSRVGPGEGLSVDRLGLMQLGRSRPFGSAPGVLGERGLGLPLCSRHASSAVESSFGSVTRDNSGLFYPSADYVAGNSEGFGNGVFGFTHAVPLDGIGVDGDAPLTRVRVSRKFDPAVAEGDSNALAVHAKVGSDLLERFAGTVEFDRLVEKRVSVYHGDVLNLSTTEGWYSANNITVSNCDCIVAPSTEKDLPPEYDPEKLYEIYKNVHESQMTGTQVAKAMRKAYGFS